MTHLYLLLSRRLWALPARPPSPSPPPPPFPDKHEST